MNADVKNIKPLLRELLNSRDYELVKTGVSVFSKYLYFKYWKEMERYEKFVKYGIKNHDTENWERFQKQFYFLNYFYLYKKTEKEKLERILSCMPCDREFALTLKDVLASPRAKKGIGTSKVREMRVETYREKIPFIRGCSTTAEKFRWPYLILDLASNPFEKAQFLTSPLS